MREILFRAYDKTMNRYKPFDGEHDTMLISRDGKVDYYNLQNGSGFDEYILEQFTGLTDKNGKKIFEGDILCANTGVKWENGIHSKYLQYALVVYNSQKARFEILGKMGESHKALDQVVNKYRATVAGNIHDNPELIP